MADYKGILVYAEVANGKIASITGELLGAARKLAAALNEPVSAAVLGSGVGNHAAELAYILFQVPVLMAVHAAEMLKKPE